MKYRDTKRKIQKLYRQGINVKSEIEKLPRLRFKDISTHKEDTFYHIANEWVFDFSGNLTLILEGLPESFLPFIRFTPMVRTQGITEEGSIWIDRVKEEQLEDGDEVTGNYIDSFTFNTDIERVDEEPKEIRVGGQVVKVFNYICYISLSVNSIFLEGGDYVPIEMRLVITVANNRLTHEIQTNQK